ncbi:carbohydrate ABC transporter permease [Streptomyces sp. 6N223]|uniref:carbohydrate ABC transporter permease n=1 Tax=Streptomyces sp. 6N223 TaxID=3457412 RepID=UPI003FD6404A
MTTTAPALPKTSARPALPPKRRRRGLRSALGTAGYHGVSVVLSVAFVFPLVWALLNSVKPTAEANQQPPTWFPEGFSLDNYEGLATYGEGIGVYAVNSVIVSVFTVLGTVAVSVLGGYGFARFEFRGKRPLFLAVLAILMVPYATILLPLYIVLGHLGLQNSLIGLSLVLVMFQLPFSVFLMRNSFESIPRELEEAAMIDGCSNFGALRLVSLRLVTPGIVTVALFAFLASWNEFLAPLIFLNDGSKYTLPIMLVNIRSGAYGSIDFGALQAGVVIAMVPCLVLYVLLQRFYVGGLTGGALRG